MAVDDGIGFNKLGHLPGEQQVLHFLCLGLTSADDLQRLFVDHGHITFLDQQAAIDPLIVESGLWLRRPFTAGQHPHIGFPGQDGLGIRVNAGGDDNLDKLALDDGPAGGGIQRLVEGDNATEGRGRIGTVGTIIGVQQRSAHGDTAGIGMFDDDAGRLSGKRLDAFQGRVGIGDIVE